MANDDPFDSPASGAKFEAKEHNGKLLLITPLEHKEGVKTASFGLKDVVVANIVVLNEQAPAASEEIEGAYIFGSVLIGQTRPKIGKSLVIGRLGQKPTDKGNPAWDLKDPTDADKVVARAYLATKAPQL
jgi:hypothetical protein